MIIRAAKKQPKLGPGLQICYLLDDDDNVVGAQLVDMEGANNLGGRMMMVPEDAIQESIASKEIPEDTRDGTSEVLNTLSACFNNIRGNPHVRTTPVRDWSAEADEWTNDPKNREDFDILPWGGRIVLLGKRV